jgi:hypothetical protein
MGIKYIADANSHKLYLAILHICFWVVVLVALEVIFYKLVVSGHDEFIDP